MGEVVSQNCPNSSHFQTQREVVLHRIIERIFQKTITSLQNYGKRPKLLLVSNLQDYPWFVCLPQTEFL